MGETTFLDEPCMVPQMGDKIFVGIEQLGLIRRLDKIAVSVVELFAQVGEHPTGDIRSA